MTTEEDRALVDSVQKLNDTATSLAELMMVVDKNQRLLVTNQEATAENTDAISLRSTKEELLKEVKRLAVERKRDRLKTVLIVSGSFLVQILLIFAIGFTAMEYKDARKNANLAYSQAAMNVCQQRSTAWTSMQEWIITQKALEAANTAITPEFKAKRIAALDELLKHFPDVDCSIGSVLTIMVPPATLDHQDNLVFAK